MHYELYLRHKCLLRKISLHLLAYTMLATLALATIGLGGCRVNPAMTFEQDRPMTSYNEQDFLMHQLPARPQTDSMLRADNTEEATYLQNIVQLLEQTKMLAASAQKQAQPQQRKVFNYNAFEVDVDTVIFAIKRYLAADDYTPRGFQALPPNRLKAKYSNVE